MSHTTSDEKITLIGAGLTGSLLAVFLAKRGFQVEVFERRSDMRSTDISAGRSINMAMSVRGLHALKQVNLAQRVLNMAIPMPGRMIHSVAGEQYFQRYGSKPHEAIHSISRGDLNKVVMDAADEYDNVTLHFDSKCEGMDIRQNILKIRNVETDTLHDIEVANVIATDGSGSAVRTAMMNLDRLNFSQDYLGHGYKELTIPANADGAFQMEKNALHIWPRGQYMLIALPNLDGSFTCTLFFPFEGEHSFESVATPDALIDFFRSQFPDALEVMPDLTSLFFTNPTGSLVTIKCAPWYYRDQVLLLGDAAHAIVPFFGQGMNCGFEDCTYLDECIENFWPDWEMIYKSFYDIRKDNSDAIATMALNNYIEMRDLVNDPGFQLRKKVGFALEEKFPDNFIPQYSMVSFHRIPYVEALKRGKTQDEILHKLCQSISSVEEIDWHVAEQLIMNERNSQDTNTHES